jgi:hypothetical protein
VLVAEACNIGIEPLVRRDVPDRHRRITILANRHNGRLRPAQWYREESH